MQEFTVKMTRIAYYSTTVVVRAESSDDAEDKATDLYYQDDGCHGVRERMEFAGGSLDIKADRVPKPLGTAESVLEPF
jgi:hypothetical protein